jgi:hypothetical protein
MEFRIITANKKIQGIYLNGKSPSELTAEEKVELIKQLCPEINRIAVSWIVSDMKNYTANFGVDRPFTDYLMEELGK